MIATPDIGLEAARILLEDSPPAVVELEGPSTSPAQVAEYTSRALGRWYAGCWARAGSNHRAC